MLSLTKLTSRSDIILKAEESTHDQYTKREGGAQLVGRLHLHLHDIGLDTAFRVSAVETTTPLSGYIPKLWIKGRHIMVGIA